jgi:iron complex transport system ATP-binding protein
MVLHDLNHACRYADYLVAVRGGQINAQGEPSQIITENLVREVFGIDCKIIPDPVTNTPLVVPIGKAEKSRSYQPSPNGKHTEPVHGQQGS